MFAPNLVTYTGYVVNQIEDGLKPGSGRTVMDYLGSIRLIRAAAIMSMGSLEFITVGLQLLLLIGPTTVKAVLELCKLKSLCGGLPDVSFSSLGILAHKTLALAVQVIVGGPMMFWDPRQCIQLYDALGLQRRVGRWSGRLGQLWVSVVGIYQMLHRVTGKALSLVRVGGSIALQYPKASAALLAFFFIVSRRLVQTVVPQPSLHSDPPPFNPPPTSPPIPQSPPASNTRVAPEPVLQQTFEPVRNPIPEPAPEPVQQSIPEHTPPSVPVQTVNKEVEPTPELIQQVQPILEVKSNPAIVEANPAPIPDVESKSEPDLTLIIEDILPRTNQSIFQDNSHFSANNSTYDSIVQTYNLWDNESIEQSKNDSTDDFPHVVSLVYPEDPLSAQPDPNLVIVKVPALANQVKNISLSTWDQFVVANGTDNNRVWARAEWAANARFHIQARAFREINVGNCKNCIVSGYESFRESSLPSSASIRLTYFSIFFRCAWRL